MELDDYESDNVWIAAAEGSTERTLQLIGTGPVDVQDQNGYTPLMAACSYGRLQLVAELLRRGANPNLKDSDGNSALHHCDYPECLNALLNAGGRAFEKNNEGQTPLDVKQEELESAREEFSDEEDLEDGEAPSAERLSRLVDVLLLCAQEEESRKKLRG